MRIITMKMMRRINTMEMMMRINTMEMIMKMMAFFKQLTKPINSNLYFA